MKKYTTLLFDADDTLLDFKRCESAAFKKMMTVRNLPLEDGDDELYSRINQSFWELFELGKIPKSAISAGRYEEFFRVKGINTDFVAAAKTYEGLLSEQHIMIDGALDLLAELSKDYDIYIITNGTDYIQKRRLTESGIADYIKGTFISETVGAPKPENKYFDYVLKNIAERDKTKVLIVGDSMSSDILGGINAGIDTCWYNPKGLEQKYKPTYQIKSLSEVKKVL